jgi:protein-S-isoprenylcysteine O-methyltransferase Ste14
MCQRPRPDFKRTPARKPVNEDIDRKLQKLEAELALLRRENDNTRTGWLTVMRNTGFLFLALSAVFLLGGHGSSNALRSMFEILGTLTLVLGLWSLLWSWRPVAEMVMVSAVSQKAG